MKDGKNKLQSILDYFISIKTLKKERKIAKIYRRCN